MITIEEFSQGALKRTIPINNRAHFIVTVDSIRSKRASGWQLKLDGEIVSEEQAFGSSVCYGVYEPSFFNDRKCPFCIQPMTDTEEISNNVHFGKAHLACILHSYAKL